MPLLWWHPKPQPKDTQLNGHTWGRSNTWHKEASRYIWNSTLAYSWPRAHHYPDQETNTSQRQPPANKSKQKPQTNWPSKTSRTNALQGTVGSIPFPIRDSYISSWFWTLDPMRACLSWPLLCAALLFGNPFWHHKRPHGNRCIWVSKFNKER